MSVTIYGIMIWINTQWAGVAILEPYRSYWVSYSHGETINSQGEWVNVWKRPEFGHSDTRPYEEGR